ncbi:hypothetical protein VNO80_17217 [Phaseolus coccineus]|uniref:Nuclear speckle splicing regulatory protein 1 N-terminal domain-containing protein n=1 Tax=Phaseolus coccineus TaxID=3886 RepID=A0AAN9R0U4_PHACN
MKPSRNLSECMVKELQKKALEEGPSIFDYDGVYDKMKAKEIRPLTQDREEKKDLVVSKFHEYRLKVLVSTWELVFDMYGHNSFSRPC